MDPSCHSFWNRKRQIAYRNKPMRIIRHYDKLVRIEIGYDVWIGSTTIIMPCKKVGSHSVVAAASVVCKDIPEYVITGGNPVQIIKKL